MNKNRSVGILPTGYLLQIERYKHTEIESFEDYILCEWKQKEKWDKIFILHKIHCNKRQRIALHNDKRFNQTRVYNTCKHLGT